VAMWPSVHTRQGEQVALYLESFYAGFVLFDAFADEPVPPSTDLFTMIPTSENPTLYSFIRYTGSTPLTVRIRISGKDTGLPTLVNLSLFDVDGITLISENFISLFTPGDVYGVTVTSDYVVVTLLPDQNIKFSGNGELSDFTFEYDTTGSSTHVDIAGDLRLTSGSLIATYDMNTIGSIITNGGNVGIGTTSPAHRLDVAGDVRVTGGELMATFDSNTVGSIITTGGNVGIGTTSPAHRLDVVGGALRVTGGGLMATFDSNTVGSIITTGGNVGIGTSSPVAKLQVNGNILLGPSAADSDAVYSINTPGQLSIHANNASPQNDNFIGFFLRAGVSTNTSGIDIFGGSQRSIGFITQNTERMRIIGNGNTGIGKTNPSYTLDVNGTFSSSNTNGSLIFATSGNVGIGTSTPGYKLSVSGEIFATGDIIAFSDQLLKTDVSTVSNALDKVNALRGVYYTMKKTGKRGLGVIAQEVQQVLPEIVDSKEEYLGVAYGNIAGVFIEAIKELSEKVRLLEDKLNLM
jgi:hypothetical protein